MDPNVENQVYLEFETSQRPQKTKKKTKKTFKSLKNFPRNPIVDKTIKYRTTKRPTNKRQKKTFIGTH